MLSAPMMMPLLGQLARLWWRVTSVVIVSPQLTLLAASAPLNATTPAKTRITVTKSPASVAGTARGRIFADILSPLSGRAGAGRLPGQPTPGAHQGQWRRARWALRSLLLSREAVAQRVPATGPREPRRAARSKSAPCMESRSEREKLVRV